MLIVSTHAIVKTLVNVWLVNWKYIRKHGKQKPATVNVQNANARRCIQTPNGVNQQWEWNNGKKGKKGKDITYQRSARHG